LAISYLGRSDLAHVEATDLLPDTIGRGESENDPPTYVEDDSRSGSVQGFAAALSSNGTSAGYVRSNLMVVNGGVSTPDGASASHLRTVTDNGVEVKSFAGAVAAAAVDPAQQAVVENDPELEQIRRARLRGYEGEDCAECGNFTLVRNGTCMKCDTCGSTSGCS
jgi:ribonucleoside-diphosphate reductase alpha chain